MSDSTLTLLDVQRLIDQDRASRQSPKYLTPDQIGEIQQSKLEARRAEHTAEQNRIRDERATAERHRKHMWRANTLRRTKARAERALLGPRIADAESKVAVAQADLLRLRDQDRELLAVMNEWAAPEDRTK